MTRPSNVLPLGQIGSLQFSFSSPDGLSVIIYSLLSFYSSRIVTIKNWLTARNINSVDQEGLGDIRHLITNSQCPSHSGNSKVQGNQTCCFIPGVLSFLVQETQSHQLLWLFRSPEQFICEFTPKCHVRVIRVIRIRECIGVKHLCTLLSLSWGLYPMLGHMHVLWLFHLIKYSM